MRSSAVRGDVPTRQQRLSLFSIDGLLSPRECAAWIRYGDGQGFERSFHRQTSEMAHRDNGRITLHSADVAAAVFARVGKFVPANMGGRCVLLTLLFLLSSPSCCE